MRARRPLLYCVVKRTLLKGLLFTALLLVVLNPSLRRAFRQVQHTLRPENLIQDRFAGLESINAQLDCLMDRAGCHSEARRIAQFVVDHINYVSDYENWGNVSIGPRPKKPGRKGRKIVTVAPS